MQAETLPMESVTADPDARLVLDAQSGDARAREELASRYRNRAFGFALQLVGNREDAWDVAQEALMRFFTHLDRVDSGRGVEPWLLRIVRNAAYDHFRRSKVRAAESLEELEEAGAPETPAPAVDPTERLERQELRRRLWRALATLSPEHREILVLRDYQDLTYEEIADVLSIPKGTVMSRLHRARKNLRDRLSERPE